MSIDTLFDQLKHPNPNLRDRAMWELAEQRDETTIPRLMAVLDEENTTYRRAAVKTLGAIGMDTVPALLEAVRTSDNVTVRGSAVKALAQVAINYPETPFPTEGIEGLQAAMDDPNPVVHVAAVMALGEIGKPVAHILVDALKTTDNLALAVSIANTLGTIGDESGIALLQELSEDESTDPYIRETAVSALSRWDQIQGLNKPQS